MIGFPCENCGTRLEISEEYVGQRVACEVCSHAMVVPASTIPDKRTPPPAPVSPPPPPPSPTPSSFSPETFSPDVSTTPLYPPPGGGGAGPTVSGTGATNPLAIASLVLGVPGLCCCLAGIPAIVCGHIALSQINQSGGAQEGRGLAVAGLVLGYLGLAWTVLSTFASMIGELAQF